MTIKDVVKNYLDKGGLTQQGLADALNQSLVNTGVSRVSVSNWLNGKYEPETDFLLVCAQVYSDWRRQFAFECLQAKLPEVFELQDGALEMIRNGG